MIRRRDLLVGAAALPFASVFGRIARAGLPATTAGHRLVVVFANGGWDVTFTLDPKLGEPEIEGPDVDEDPANPEDREAIRVFSGIPIAVNPVKRPAVTAFFDRWAPRSVVVNGLWVGAIAHDPCRWRMLTGAASSSGPDLTAITGAELGVDLPLGALDTSGDGLSGSLAASVGTVGARGQLELLLDPAATPPPPAGAPPRVGFVPTEAEAALIARYTAERADAHRAAWGPAGTATFDALAEATTRAERLVGSRAALIDGLELGVEPTLGGLIDTTVAMLSDRQCQAVLLDSGFTWDTHEGNASQHGYWNGLFTQLSRLAAALDRAALLDDTLVVVVSEMTRTPKRNEALGKDHWPHTSALLFGGPTRGGRVCGATDGLLESLPMDFATGAVDPAGALCQYDNFVAGVLAMVGVDPERWLPGSEPFRGAG